MITCDWCGKMVEQPMVSISPDEYPDNWVNHMVFHRDCFEDWFEWSKVETENKMISSIVKKMNISSVEDCTCDIKE